MICELLCGAPFHMPPGEFMDLDLSELEWWANRAMARLKRENERVKNG